MNLAGEARAEQLVFQQRSAVEERKELIRTRNMSLICHCSGEIDDGVLRYFGVNEFYIGTGDYILMLASDFSDPQDLNGIVNVFQRTCVYSLVEEIALSELTGRFTFYSAQVDGRLAFLFCFLNGLPEQELAPMFEQLTRDCRRISTECQRLYELDVVLYISRICTHVEQCSNAYERIQLLATLHRFIGRQHIESIIQQRVVLSTMPPDPSAVHELPFETEVQAIVNALLSGTQAHALLDASLERFLLRVPSIQHLLEACGQLFELLCAQLRMHGVRFADDHFRRELVLLADRVHEWDEIAAWFHNLLDHISRLQKNTRFEQQAAAIQRARAYLDDNFIRSSLSLEEVAAHAGLKLSTFTVAFQASQHCSPSVYLRQLRLKRAAQLLRTTNLTVAAIAEQCGFGSIETFHRVFKAAYGLTPGRLRKIATQSSHPSDPEE